MKSCFRLLNKHSLPAQDLHSSADVSDTRKLDFSLSLNTVKHNFFLLTCLCSIKGFGCEPLDNPVTGVLLTPLHFACSSSADQQAGTAAFGRSFPRVCTQPGCSVAAVTGKEGPGHGESVLMRITVAVISPHPDCRPPQLSLLLLRGA